MYCKECKNTLKKSEKFCSKCGAEASSVAIKKPIYKRTWFIVIAVLLVLSFIGKLVGNPQDEAKEMHEKYYTKLNSLSGQFNEIVNKSQENIKSKKLKAVDSDKLAANEIKELILPTISTMYEEVRNEKVSKDIEPLKDELSKAIYYFKEISNSMATMDFDALYGGNQSIGTPLLVALDNFKSSKGKYENDYNSFMGIKEEKEPLKDTSVTMEKFTQIKEGMTYAQVVEIMGSEGVEHSSMALMGSTLKTYAWSAPLNLGVITVSFSDNIVTSKVQLGLK